MSKLPMACPHCGQPAVGEMLEQGSGRLVIRLYACGGYASLIGEILGGDWHASLKGVQPDELGAAPTMGVDWSHYESNSLVHTLQDDLAHADPDFLPTVKTAARDMLEYTGSSFIQVMPGARRLLGPFARYGRTRLHLDLSGGSIYWYQE